jgi:hypothetical protein
VRVQGLEATIRRRDAVLAAVSYAAAHFLGPADWDRDVREVLGRLGSAASGREADSSSRCRWRERGKQTGGVAMGLTRVLGASIGNQCHAAGIRDT